VLKQELEQELGQEQVLVLEQGQQELVRRELL